jgi:hypothetical protein
LLVSPGLTPRRSERDEMIVNLVEEAGKVDGYVLECFIVPQMASVFMKRSDLALS